MDLRDERQLALMLARTRAFVGLALLALPGLAGRLMLGWSVDTPGGRAALRLLGAREIGLGLGAITTVKEQSMGAEWTGVGAVLDGVDAVVLLATPGLPARSRLGFVVPAIAAVVGLRTAKALAAARAEAYAAVNLAVSAETIA